MNPNNNAEVMKQVLMQERLAVLEELAMLETGRDSYETVYDRLTELASKLVSAPIALVSMVDAEFQFYKSHYGLPPEIQAERKTPLSHSYCKHVVATKEPLIVTDAREVDILKDNPAIPDMNAIGYLGIPITLGSGHTLGSFCVVDAKPREWTDEEVQIMTELAQVITGEIDMKARARVDPKFKPRLESLHDNINTMIAQVNPNWSKAKALAQIRKLRRQYGI